MTLRKKTLVIIGVTLIGLMAALYTASWVILLGGFAQVEEQNTHENVQRALDALSEDLVRLNTTTGDPVANGRNMIRDCATCST